MNPVLRELQRQLNDIAKQLAALQRQETVLSNPVTYSGTPTANSMAYWTGAGTVAHASFGTADVVRTSGNQTIAGTKTFSAVGDFDAGLDVSGGTFEFDPGNGADATRAFNFNIVGSNYGKILIPSGSGGAMAFWTGSAGAAAERMRIHPGGAVEVPHGIRSGSVTIADDSFTLLAAANIPTRGMLFLATGVNADEAAIIAYRLDATSVCTLMVGMGATAVSTSALNGTTGADNFCTVSATTSGLYIENRHGASRTFRYLLMGE